ncbi:MAG TPA: DoxX family protein [Candidatus Limnocylindrales bacterium]|jgi:putative oxidoreductase|nr:DoxX family protein [Candidatus Limnocylindrales bacterium]
MFKKLFAPTNDCFLTSLSLLILRVWLGATLLLNHGIGKVKGFSTMSGGFPDPHHVGHAASLALVIFAEVVASALLVLGLVTRFAALVIAVNMAVAFVYAHKMSLSGNHSGELAFTLPRRVCYSVARRWWNNLVRQRGV